MLSNSLMDNYIAKVTAYLSSELSDELGISIVDSMLLLMEPNLYSKITDQTHHHYQMSLDEAYSLLKDEVLPIRA